MSWVHPKVQKPYDRALLISVSSQLSLKMQGSLSLVALLQILKLVRMDL